MSLDLDWTLLDAQLASVLAQKLNGALQSASRPSFIGPIHVDGLDFGSEAPQAEVIDVRDIWPDFLDRDDDEGDGPPYAPETGAIGEEQEGDRDGSALGGGPPSSSGLPTLQIHLSLTYPTASFRLSLSTSLLINYPSPLFMSLPLRLEVTGLLFQGVLVLAIEGDKRRLHLSILEDDRAVPSWTPSSSSQDGPSSESESVPVARGAFLSPSAAPELGAERHRPGFTGPTTAAAAAAGGGAKTTPGTRLLPYIQIESEVGQADKHVLKNVGKVEKFVQDVLRKALEDELCFPSFYTIVL